MNKMIEIKFVKQWPEEDIVDLYKAGGWWKDHYNSSGIKSLIAGSFAFAVAVEKKSGEAIGMGRVISDGFSDAYIQDLVVLPGYRKQGVGKQIVEALLDKCLSEDLLWVGLIAEPGQDKFYTTMGFKQMEKHVPMKYQPGE